MQKHVGSLCSQNRRILKARARSRSATFFVNSLRMRPDRIIIGEVRSDEMLDMIESISSGHSGSLAIIHSESPEDLRQPHGHDDVDDRDTVEHRCYHAAGHPRESI